MYPIFIAFISLQMLQVLTNIYPELKRQPEKELATPCNKYLINNEGYLNVNARTLYFILKCHFYPRLCVHVNQSFDVAKYIN